MFLKSVKITDFRSVKGSTTLLLDSSITVLLGSNDHGKSNLLRAIEHLNDENPISADEVNWDATGSAATEYVFRLTDSEKSTWAAELRKMRSELEALRVNAEVRADAKALEEAMAEETKAEDGEDPPAEAPPPATPAKPTGSAKNRPPLVATPDEDEEDVEDEEDESDAAKQEREELDRINVLTDFFGWSPHDVPNEVVIARTGVESELMFGGRTLHSLPREIEEFFRGGIPRVELFKLTGELQDSVSADELNTEHYEFMQGLFFYAGLNPADAAPLFEQDDVTERQIQDASKVLDGHLRRLWGGQGTPLHFSLAHRKDKIEFLADDPAVKKRKARMSKRSDGVTQFFRTSIVLHARRKKHAANHYLYLFDEPGVYLHPQGQKDLMQVFEQLGADSQIVYATHSIFMLNQNFPERHRLIIKDEEGTKIDAKPHRANWRLATDALGVFLTSSILFSSHVLLVEGDSDPLYLFEFLRQINRFGELDADANRLGIMSFGDAQNLRFLLQVLKQNDGEVNVAVLFDGDDSGTKMQTRVLPLCDRLGIKRLQLDKGTSIEDYCFHEPTFVAAVTKTLRDAREAGSDKSKLPADFDTQVKTAWDQHKNAMTLLRTPAKAKDASQKRDEQRKDEQKSDEPEKNTPITAGKWFQNVAKELIGDEASKVALARNYTLACRELDEGTLKQVDHSAARRICKAITEALALPRRASDRAIGLTD